MPDNARWAPWLKPGETLIWSGRPGAAWTLRRADRQVLWIAPMILGFPVYAFFLPALVDGAPGPGDWPFWFAALMVLMAVLGLVLIPGRIMITRAVRRPLHYALTDQRAMILNDRTLFPPKSIQISEMNRLDLVRHGRRATIWFKDERILQGWLFASNAPPVEVGFELIDDADRVMADLCRLGAGQAPGSAR